MFFKRKVDKSLFFLFSSDSSPRYKRNVLDVLCYPDGHIFRFRYQDKYVSNEIRSWGRNSNEIEEKLETQGGKGVVIYAETTDNRPKDFNFFPVREVKIVNIKVEGTIYYVDIELGKFINYFAGLDNNAIQDDNLRSLQSKENLENFQNQIKSNNFYPLPKPNKNEDSKLWDKKSGELTKLSPNTTFENKTQGYYFTLIKETSGKGHPLEYITSEHFSNSSWESVIDVISSSSSMQSSIFYRILGFYTQKTTLFFFNNGEQRNKTQNDGVNTTYSLPMGKISTLKLLFYKAAKAWDENPEVKEQCLEIKNNSDVFAGFSQTEIQILSRYNEELIQIACKRVFDSVFAPITIQLKKSEKTRQQETPTQPSDDESSNMLETAEITLDEIIAPQPYLITKVSVPILLVLWILFFTVSASILLTFSPDSFKTLGETNFVKQNAPDLSDYLMKNGGFLTVLFKAFGAVCALIVAFLTFRKLPVGGK